MWWAPQKFSKKVNNFTCYPYIYPYMPIQHVNSFGRVVKKSYLDWILAEPE